MLFFFVLRENLKSEEPVFECLLSFICSAKKAGNLSIRKNQPGGGFAAGLTSYDGFIRPLGPYSVPALPGEVRYTALRSNPGRPGLA